MYQNVIDGIVLTVSHGCFYFLAKTVVVRSFKIINGILQSSVLISSNLFFSRFSVVLVISNTNKQGMIDFKALGEKVKLEKGIK